MSVSDSALSFAAVSLSHDLLGDKGKSGTLKMRLCSLAVGTAVVLFSFFGTVSMPEIILSSEFSLSVLVSAFAPTVLFCLYSEIITSVGSICSVSVGIASSVVLYYLGFFRGIESLPLSFALSSVVLFCVSLIDRRKPSAKIHNEYGRTAEIVRMK